MSNALNYLIAVILIIATSCNSQKGNSNTVTTNASHGIVSIKTWYKTPPTLYKTLPYKDSIAYYEYYYTDKFVPFLPETFWKDNRNQPKDEPIRMQSYTETTSLEPKHLDVITILAGQDIGELLVLRKEKEGFIKILNKKIDGRCTFSGVRLEYISNKEYPDFIISCVSNKAVNVIIYQWDGKESLTPLYEEGLFRNGPGKTAMPSYEIPPDEMKLYPNKVKLKVFGGNALGGGVEIKKIGNETEVIEYTDLTNNYYKWNGKVFELFKVEKIKQ